MLNTNSFHNIANIVMVALAMLTAGLMATGCSATAAGGFDCTGSFLDPKIVLWLISGIGVLKVLVNVARDGFGGLFKPQPPVQQ